jgi:translation initiation factor 1A
MPQLKRGNQRTRKDIRRGEDAGAERRELLFAETDQTYGTVTAILGSGRFTVMCHDGRDRLGILRGKLHRRQWVRVDSTVLLGLRDFEPTKADIIHVYQHTEVRLLQQYGELCSVAATQEEDGIDFDEI